MLGAVPEGIQKDIAGFAAPCPATRTAEVVSPWPTTAASRMAPAPMIRWAALPMMVSAAMFVKVMMSASPSLPPLCFVLHKCFHSPCYYITIYRDMYNIPAR